MISKNTPCTETHAHGSESSVAPDSLTLWNINTVLNGGGCGKTTWYAMVRDGVAPAPVKVTSKRVAWVKSEVLEFRARLIEMRNQTGVAK